MGLLGRASVMALAATCLVSCGGGDSSTPGPIATATPTPTPTPPPPPTFSYTKFAELTGTQDFGTACTTWSVRGNGVPATDNLVQFLADGIVDFDADNEIWEILETLGGRAYQFGPDDIVSQDSAATNYRTGTPPSGFSVAIPSAGGFTAEYGRVSRSTLVIDSGPVQNASCVFGVATDPEDFPAATTVVYEDLYIRGWVFDEVAGGGGFETSRIVDGSGSITGNTSTGDVEFSLFYEVEATDGTRRTIGPLTGGGTVDVSEDRAGVFALLNMDSTPEYQLNAAFFGPSGSELAFSASADVDTNRDGAVEQLIVIEGYAFR